jgi:glucokinase
MTRIVAADLGGTLMRVALVDHAGVLTDRAEQATGHGDLVPAALVDMMRAAVAAGGTEVVVGLPGPVDYERGELVWAPNLPPSWYAELSEEALGAQVGVPVQLANDADLAAVGEAMFGAGRPYRDVAYLTISTGIGAGLVTDGGAVAVCRSLGEVGHTIIDREAWDSGAPATLEELASGTALTRLAWEAGLGDLEGHEVEERYAAGDERAGSVWRTAVRAASIGVINLLWSFAPEVVVIGGGLGRRPRFFTPLAEEVAARTTIGQPAPPVVLAQLVGDSGLVGAARWSEAMAASRALHARGATYTEGSAS